MFPARLPGPSSGGTALADLPPIPGHELHEVLGRGGMGVVYKARHLRLNREVAVKMLLTGAHAAPEDRERFLREAGAAAGLRHPNIVQVYDMGDKDGQPYFTMEFVEGGNLAGRLAGIPQPPRPSAELLATLADAVEAAHRSGIVHRDLKPSNVLLTVDGMPKISDFGLARRMEGESGLTWTGIVIGTPSYMAPEQAEAKPLAWGPAVDIYSLGAVLYELLTGRPPFRAETATETVCQVITQDPVPPSRLNGKVPRDLETICLKCLHKEPRLRYDGAAALAADLRRFLAGEAIAAKQDGRLARLIRRVRRRPVLSAAVGVGSLVAVALLGGGFWLISDRATVARKAESDRLATEQAAADDLRDMARSLKQSSWSEARIALERAKGRLGNQGSAETRSLLDRGVRDLEFAARMEAIHLEFALRQQGSNFPLPDEPPYETAFRESGIGKVGDDPGAVADQVRASNIRDALVATLDHWSGCTKDPHRKEWVLAVARKADPGSTGWRDRARDPVVRTDEAALVGVIEAAQVADESVSLLLSLDMQLDARDEERLPFLTRIQQAHPGDFWINLALANVVGRENNLEAVRYYQAAVSIRPQLAFGHDNLGRALLRAGRTEEAIVSLRQAVDLEPTSIKGHRLLVDNLSRLGLYDEAIDRLVIAIRLNPAQVILRSDLARILEAKGRHAEALDQVRQAVALEPRNMAIQRQLRDLLPPDSEERLTLPSGPGRTFGRK
jgi:serine/threonine-protein kinase